MVGSVMILPQPKAPVWTRREGRSEYLKPWKNGGCGPESRVVTIL
jgi:hypothetical protein